MTVFGSSESIVYIDTTATQSQIAISLFEAEIICVGLIKLLIPAPPLFPFFYYINNFFYFSQVIMINRLPNAIFFMSIEGLRANHLQINK